MKTIPRADGRGRSILRWMVGVYFVVQLTAGLLLDHVWPQIRFPGAYAIFACQELAGPPGPDIVFLGSSRFGLAIQSARMEKDLRRQSSDDRVQVVNFSVPAGELVTFHFLVDHLLGQGARPRLIFLEILPEALGQRMAWFSFHVHRQLTWADFPEHFLESCRTGYIHRHIWARTQALYTHRESLWRALAPAATIPAPANSPNVTASVPIETLLERSRIGVKPIRLSLANYRIGPNPRQYLEDILKHCQEAGIEVVLVAPPLSAMHRELYQPHIEQAFLAQIAEFRAKYGVAFHDYRASMPDELFRDNHHLEPEGAERFSDLLTGELLVPLWQRSSSPLAQRIASPLLQHLYVANRRLRLGNR